jgi:hypothetical protein
VGQLVDYMSWSDCSDRLAWIVGFFCGLFVFCLFVGWLVCCVVSWFFFAGSQVGWLVVYLVG